MAASYQYERPADLLAVTRGDQIWRSTGGLSVPTAGCAAIVTEQAGRPSHALPTTTPKVTSRGTRGKSKHNVKGTDAETGNDVEFGIDCTAHLIQPVKGATPDHMNQKTGGPAKSSTKQARVTRPRQAQNVSPNHRLQRTAVTRSPRTKKRVNKSGKQVLEAVKTVKKRRQQKRAKQPNNKDRRVYPQPIMDAEMACSCRQPVQPISPEFSIQCEQCSKWYHSSCAG